MSDSKLVQALRLYKDADKFESTGDKDKAGLKVFALNLLVESMSTKEKNEFAIDIVEYETQKENRKELRL